MTSVTSKKSRHLPLLEYLEVLIKEYFVADIRRKIYPKRKDREYWAKVSDGKKSKILDISHRLQLPNIFENSDTGKKYYDIYFPPNHVPYVILNDKDLRWYYCPGKDVIALEGGKTIFGEIAKTDLKDNTVTVRPNDAQQETTYKMFQVRRIL